MTMTATLPTIFQAAERNKQPIADILKSIFNDHFGQIPFRQYPSDSSFFLKCLEIGSATGQHLAHFASNFPGVQFQPSDLDSKLFDSINAFRRMNQLTNLMEPIELDLTWPFNQWPVAEESVEIVYCSNVVHISPWKCSEGLFDGAAKCLKRPGGILIMYGPFSIDGILQPQSNIDFDRSLKERNPQWGVREVRHLEKLANKHQMKLDNIIEMPANNKMILFKFI